jgi:hypothetical protein
MAKGMAMRATPSDQLERARIREGKYASRTGDMHGAFVIIRHLMELLILSSGHDDKYGWEHVSVSVGIQPPSWDQMCFVKDLFWDEDECVIQYHPPRSEYVNFHPGTLHLWKPRGVVLPLPPSLLVGPKDA